MPPRTVSVLPLAAQLANGEGRPIGLAELAAQDGRSPFHLQRSFSRFAGESPLQFSRRVRLQRATAELRATSKTVLEIALDAGFESHEGFTRAFKARYGRTPSRFRDDHRLGEAPDLRSRHLEVTHRSAPCLAFYRTPLDGGQPSKSKKGAPVMSYEIEKKELAEVQYLFMERKIEMSQIPEALGEMFGAVFEHATSNGIAFAGPPTARYPSMGPGLLTLQAGMPVTGASGGHGEIQLGSLGGGAAACTIHKGPYDQLSKAHEALQAWVDDNGETLAGAPAESYVTDPGEVPNPEEWITEVSWPLACT